ncbi:L-lysine exporter family protein LysE/ArgO [Asanoa hainanensis]|uniref:L-lysine exporter family protein LysE/ArgO n=1 Tax=Asanoa hainanensis TaxID=560556 RepID=A0A239KDW4_9ACTN|nr:LysE/ArgO family amino acid transporter [Asanoa hainanensis]SNT15294.1 L-lysine exporter family protein LysE/ArgO [Asanoa hainanensis]
MLTSVLAGFANSIALIAAIGAQNAFVLRQGLRREHVWAVVVVCALSDALLISIGVAGMGTAIADRPVLLQVAKWCGAAFLLGYAVLAARRAMRPAVLDPGAARPATLRATLVACLAFTYLNPHVYLDTVLLLGAVASQHRYQWVFAAGAVAASVVWFAALGGAAHKLAPVLARPAAWRVLDGLVATIMVAIAVGLLWA